MAGLKDHRDKCKSIHLDIKRCFGRVNDIKQYELKERYNTSVRIAGLKAEAETHSYNDGELKRKCNSAIADQKEMIKQYKQDLHFEYDKHREYKNEIRQLQFNNRIENAYQQERLNGLVAAVDVHLEQHLEQRPRHNTSSSSNSSSNSSSSKKRSSNSSSSKKRSSNSSSSKKRRRTDGNLEGNKPKKPKNKPTINHVKKPFSLVDNDIVGYGFTPNYEKPEEKVKATLYWCPKQEKNVIHLPESNEYMGYDKPFISDIIFKSGEKVEFTFDNPNEDKVTIYEFKRI